jgi:outer membrane lipoprotein carrier protein
MMIRLLTCFAALTALVSAASDANALRSAVESRYRHARTLKAAFFERYTDGNGVVAAESGTVYFSRPGRMRWEYQSPETKLFLIDGKSAWLYVPADRVVSRAKVGESSDWRTPLVLLAGKADLSVFCRKIEIAAEGLSGGGNPPRKLAEGDALLRCIPKGDANSADALTAVFLETDADAYMIRITLRQAGSVETEFRFGNWEENLAIQEDKFHFQPPPGVSVVDEESLANQFR